MKIKKKNVSLSFEFDREVAEYKQKNVSSPYQVVFSDNNNDN